MAHAVRRAAPRASAIWPLLLMACSTVKVQQVVPRSADTYRFSESTSGFRVSADPYVEKERLKQAFGCDLLERHVLPVLVVIENHSAEDGYVVLQDRSRLMMTPKDSTEGPIEPGPDRANEAAGSAYGMAVVTPGAILVSPIGLALLPLGFFAVKQAENESIILKNLQDKQMLDKTLYPGGSQSGFVYFGIDGDKDAARLLGIQLALRNVRTEEVLPIAVTTRSPGDSERIRP